MSLPFSFARDLFRFIYLFCIYVASVCLFRYVCLSFGSSFGASLGPYLFPSFGSVVI